MSDSKRPISKHDIYDIVDMYRRIPFCCTLPLVIHHKSNDPILHSATGFLVTFDGKKIFLVTNWHVINIFSQCINEYKTAMFSIADKQAFDPISRLKTHDEKRDVSVIDVSDLSFDFSKNKRTETFSPISPFVIPEPWMPKPLLHNDNVVFGGWPEEERRQEGFNVEFAAKPFVGLFIDDVRDTFFTITLERKHYLSTPRMETSPLPEGTNFSGLSGSPVFRMIRSPIERLELAGMIKEYVITQDVLLCASLQDLQKDGKFSKM